MIGAGWLLLGAALAGAVAGALWLMERRRVRRRAQALTDYLEAAVGGRELVLTRQEDDFSLLEDELCKTVGELRIAKELAQQERLQQADNLADIAHQLKTPITSMSLMTQLLYGQCRPEDWDCLNRMSSQLERLERLTTALLTMSRLDAEAIVFVREPVGADELAARAVEPVEEAMEAQNQRFAVEGAQGLTLTCDPSWTAEALVNLIKNCSEHSPLGGEIRLSFSENPLYTQILVEDSGPGFPPDELPKLFRRFYRGAGAAKDSIGIGLALARSIVERQNGSLRAENRSQGGARFILHFYR